MKPRWKLMVLAVVTAIAVVSLAGVASAAGAWDKNGASMQGERGRSARPDGRGATTATSLSVEMAEQIVFMREEEKLARDVYTFLFEKWGAEEFKNIANSESRHMTRVEVLIDRYGLEDPVTTDVPGEFKNQDLQAVYDSMIAQGSRSLEEAYRVGVAIEELDIADLKAALAEATPRDVGRVFQNLVRGSERHLAAFTRLLNR